MGSLSTSLDRKDNEFKDICVDLIHIVVNNVTYLFSKWTFLDSASYELFWNSS